MAGNPAAAPAPAPVTLAGSFQSELGCPGDWQPDCTRTDLAVQPNGHAAGTFTIPAGSYEFKVAINHSWDENYGAGGVRGAEQNIPLVLAAPAAVSFDYDPSTLLVAIASAKLPDRTLTRSDRQLAGSSLRKGSHPGTLLLRDDRPIRQRRQAK